MWDKRVSYSTIYTKLKSNINYYIVIDFNHLEVFGTRDRWKLSVISYYRPCNPNYFKHLSLKSIFFLFPDLYIIQIQKNLHGKSASFANKSILESLSEISHNSGDDITLILNFLRTILFLEKMFQHYYSLEPNVFTKCGEDVKRCLLFALSIPTIMEITCWERTLRLFCFCNSIIMRSLAGSLRNRNWNE